MQATEWQNKQVNYPLPRLYSMLSHQSRFGQHNGEVKTRCKALAKRLDFSLDFLLDKKSRKKSSRLATLLSESSGVE